MVLSDISWRLILAFLIIKVSILKGNPDFQWNGDEPDRGPGQQHLQCLWQASLKLSNLITFPISQERRRQPWFPGVSDSHAPNSNHAEQFHNMTCFPPCRPPGPRSRSYAGSSGCMTRTGLAAWRSQRWWRSWSWSIRMNFQGKVYNFSSFCQNIWSSQHGEVQQFLSLTEFYLREQSVEKAEQMFAQLDEDGNGDLTEVKYRSLEPYPCI